MGRTAVTVAIGGGKGGVGKSVVAANLAIRLARLGSRVIVVDADLGSANQHTIFGIDRPGMTLQALVEGRISSLEEVVVPTVAPRVHLVPGSGAVVGAANIGHARKMKLIRHIAALDTDVIIVDCGAGSGFDVVDLYDMADLRMVVVAPQLTSMQNAYAFLKSALFRSMRKCAINERERALFDSSTGGTETERVSDVIARVGVSDALFAEALSACVDAFEGHIVGNLVDGRGQRRALGSLSAMFHDFLSLDVPLLAALPHSSAVHRSVSRRRPHLLEHAHGAFADELMLVAERIMTANVTSIRSARRRVPPSEQGRLPGPLANYIRAHDRFIVDRSCRVRNGAVDRPGRILDISAGGMRLDTDLSMREGEAVEVHVDEYVAHCTVERVAGQEVGVSWRGEGSALLASLREQNSMRASA
ncbi:MAG: P-loop NTPase [Myxococcota bacterium]